MLKKMPYKYELITTQDVENYYFTGKSQLVDLSDDFQALCNKANNLNVIDGPWGIHHWVRARVIEETDSGYDKYQMTYARHGIKTSMNTTYCCTVKGCDSKKVHGLAIAVTEVSRLDKGWAGSARCLKHLPREWFR